MNEGESSGEQRPGELTPEPMDQASGAASSAPDSVGADALIGSAHSPAEIAAPVAQRERIIAIDVLRGFALLGILVMNIWAFAMPFAAYANPTAYGGETGADWAAYVISHVFFDQKMMSIFSMLFGAGVLIMTSRTEEKQGRSAGVHYRRMGWLLLIGLAHAFLIWWGDILVLYAVCGMLVYLLRKLKPRTLAIIAVILQAPPMMMSVGQGFAMIGMEQQLAQPDLAPERREKLEQGLEQFRSFWQPSQESIDKEIAAMTGGYDDELAYRAPFLAVGYIYMIPLWGLWRAGGMMLIGMALFKWGVLSVGRSRAFYLRLAAFGLAVGLPLVIAGYLLNVRTDWDQVQAMQVNGHFNYVGSVLVALGYVGLIMLFCQSNALGMLKRSLAAVGQMALTNYLMHSIICTTIFYGRGFGLFGELSRSEQVLIVLGVWVFQLIASPIWLKYFRFGPFEWLWRSLSYWKMQPLVRAGR